MEKIIYWLKKVGILRSASYKVKGDAKQLVEMDATDGGMIQSQEKIDKEYTENMGEKLSKTNERRNSKVLFWIFLFLAVIFLIAYLGSEFSFGSFVVLIFWAIFLFLLKKGEVAWASSFITIMVIGLGLVVLSLFFVDSSEETSISSESQIENSIEDKTADKKCDDANSEYADFNKIEETIVSINPCDVPWILAKPVENYDLETKNGTILKVTVFNNYVNNVKAGESYTIRVLDIEEDITRQSEVTAGISIVRWTPNAQTLPSAKKEVREIVEDLEY